MHYLTADTLLLPAPPSQAAVSALRQTDFLQHVQRVYFPPPRAPSFSFWLIFLVVWDGSQSHGVWLPLNLVNDPRNYGRCVSTRFPFRLSPLIH